MVLDVDTISETTPSLHHSTVQYVMEATEEQGYTVESVTYWFVLVSSVWWVVFGLSTHLLTVHGPYSRTPHPRVATPHILVSL